ncbi:hypothetical protein A3864_01940 [Priestia endophytica]|uniref:Uncharacterized protein n=2 Tax=Priestia endophytica TaxID=135735 RepID=A0AAX1QGH9_9BACI|nr:hypothetical protein A3864_01940 [Priestia endophytica]
MGNGGAERVISVLSNELINRGIEVNILTIYGDRVDYPLNPGINHYAIECKSTLRFLRPIERIYKIRKYLKKIKTDTVVSFLADVNIHTLLATILMNLKVVVSERNDPYNDPSSKLIRNIRDRVYYLSDGFVFQTPDAKAYFPEKIQRKGTIIANPIKDNLPTRWKGERKKEIVCVSRLSPQKNIKMLIDSYYKFEKEYPNYLLKIYGEGPLRTELENYVEELSLTRKVIFCGFKKDIHAEIKESSLFVLSSNYEGISNSMLEALAMGLPVISTNCPIGGSRMFINSYDNGILVPVGDSSALYEAMKNVIKDPELANKLSENATDINNELNPRKVCEKWFSYLESIKRKVI